MAYKIACIGVTEQDWRALGIDALLSKNFYLAKKAFVRIRDLKYIDLCDLSEQMHQMKTLNE
jgi:intraflagellar transport protein 122